VYDYRFYDDAFGAWTMIHQTWHAMRRSEERRLANVKVTPEELEVLWISGEYPAPLTPTEISRAVFREAQTVSGLLDRMERKGLVRRVPRRKGRPFTEVQTTAKGQELCNRGKEVDLAHISKMMSRLSAEELKQLQQLLRKVRQNVLEELNVELLPPPNWTSA
jgi:DNA-binding MarR family transcriptional regulator